jgi:hypothetical protein
MSMVSKRQLVGRRIINFDPGSFNDSRGGVAHDPVITLDDGSVLSFSVEETDTGDYGIHITKTKLNTR